jgi:hypothetical protein
VLGLWVACVDADGVFFGAFDAGIDLFYFVEYLLFKGA